MHMFTSDTSSDGLDDSYRAFNDVNDENAGYSGGVTNFSPPPAAASSHSNGSSLPNPPAFNPPSLQKDPFGSEGGGGGGGGGGEHMYEAPNPFGETLPGEI